MDGPTEEQSFFLEMRGRKKVIIVLLVSKRKKKLGINQVFCTGVLKRVYDIHFGPILATQNRIGFLFPENDVYLNIFVIFLSNCIFLINLDNLVN